MTVHVHELKGCSPVPLARYLKALGILRIVAEQRDATARGWWQHGAFRLATTLSAEDLVTFLVDAWRPTPIVTPWNADGGFIGNGTDAKVARETLIARDPDRFSAWVSAVARAAEAVDGRTESPKDEDKLRVFLDARAEWDDDALGWLDAVVTLLPDAEKGSYPALLASGGCDGRFDFGAAHRKRLLLFFGDEKRDRRVPSATLRALARLALYSDEVVAKLAGASGGQFDPGSTSPVNGGAGFRGKSAVNPWDFVLALEGVPTVRSAAARRLDSDAVKAAAPFAVWGSSAGYASAAAKDGDGRGEQWMPLWSRPATFKEVQRLFGEGRMMTGGRPATDALSAAKAIARLGVARGLDAFERYGYAPRNGQASLAVPLGRWCVVANPRVRLLDEIEDWLARMRRAANAAESPGSLVRDVRRIEAAMLEVCPAGASARRWQDLIELLGEAEAGLVARPKFTKEAYLQPLPPLSLDWLLAANDQSIELRLAAGIVLQRHGDLGPFRAHVLPLKKESGWRRFATGEGALASDPDVVWSGGDLVGDLVAVAGRRIQSGVRSGIRAFGLDGPLRATLGDVEAFLRGATDDVRIARLARGLMALNVKPADVLPDLGGAPGEPSALHALVRLTHLARDLDTVQAKLHARIDPSVARLLAAGRLDEAVAAMCRHLRVLGLSPRIRFALGSPALARRLAATIAMPVSPRDLERLLRYVTKPDLSNLGA